jgi:hypothetical protein
VVKTVGPIRLAFADDDDADDDDSEEEEDDEDEKAEGVIANNCSDDELARPDVVSLPPDADDADDTVSSGLPESTPLPSRTRLPLSSSSEDDAPLAPASGLSGKVNEIKTERDTWTHGRDKENIESRYGRVMRKK